MSDGNEGRHSGTAPSGCWIQFLALLLFLGAFYFFTLVVIPNAA